MATLSRVSSRRSRRARAFATYAALIALTVVFLFPLLWIVSLSLKTRLQMFNAPPLSLWWPTLENYAAVLNNASFAHAFVNSVIVSACAVSLSLLVGVPAAYAMARRNFPGKQMVMLLFLLPLLVPPITYGIPMATVLYRVHLAGTISGVILANLVPTVPFVILIMIPFVEQIDPRVEAAARVFGAGMGRLFVQVLVPLLTPGILAALLLVLVRTIAMFELTFLTAGPNSQTLVVALYYAVFAAGVRPQQSIDAMAVVYMITTLIWLLIALRFEIGRAHV